MSSSKLSPVQKVIAMLQDMSKNLEKELKQDEDMYNKLACWCHTNSGEKAAAIEAAVSKIALLESSIEAGTAKKAELTEGIAQLTEELKANTESLAKATEVREKELKEFQTQEKSDLVNVQSLKAAIVVLSKLHGEKPNETEQKKDAFKYSGLKGPIGGDFLQTRSRISLLDDDVSRVNKMVSSRFDSDTARRVLSALQDPQYNNQSGEIFGILNQMLEDMQEDLSEASKEENAKATAFQELRAAKEEEIESATQLKEQKEIQLAKTMKKIASDKEDLEDTEQQLGDDREFVQNLSKQCATIDEQWEARQKVRHEEMLAVTETIGILTSDDAKDTFHNNFGHGEAEVVQAPQGTVTALLQLESHRRAFSAREQAAHLLKQAAKRSKDDALVLIATSVQLDAFTRVKKSINDMIAMLKQQQSDEVKQKEFCETQFHQNEQDTTKTNFHKEDVQQNITDLEGQIETLVKELSELASSIQEAKVELQRAGEDRLEQSKVFTRVLADQQATEKVLQIALNRMEAFYKKKEAFIQHKQAPPGQFQEYKPSAASSPILSMLADLITDAVKMQKEAINDEQKATTEYAEFVASTNTSISNMTRATVNKTKIKADREQQLNEAKDELIDTVKKLEGLSEYNGQLHLSCDFVQKNFDIRQKARSDEVEALNAALGILSGA